MILVRWYAKLVGSPNIPRCIVNSMQNGYQYQAAFDEHYRNFPASLLGPPNRFGQDCYDAAWILALALNNTLTGKTLHATYV